MNDEILRIKKNIIIYFTFIAAIPHILLLNRSSNFLIMKHISRKKLTNAIIFDT